MLWLRGKDARSNTTTLSPPEMAGQFVDYAVSGDDGWALGNYGLDIVDLRSNEPGYNYRAYIDSMKNELGLVLSSGLRAARTNQIPFPQLRLTAGGWRGESEGGPQQLSLRVEGVWNPAIRAGLIRETELRSKSGSAGMSILFRASGSIPLEALDRTVSENVEWSTDDKSSATLRAVIKSAARISDSEFAAHLRRPVEGGSDPVRGEVRPARIRDARPGVRRETVISAAERRELSLPDDPREREVASIRVTGWVVLGILCVALVLIRVRRGSVGA